MTTERLEVQRTIEADAASIFKILSDPHGHVAIDSSGMLLDATGDPVAKVGDEFVVHMDREALNDYPEAGIFPVISELALRATLGILARTVQPKR